MSSMRRSILRKRSGVKHTSYKATGKGKNKSVGFRSVQHVMTLHTDLYVKSLKAGQTK